MPVRRRSVRRAASVRTAKKARRMKAGNKKSQARKVRRTAARISRTRRAKPPKKLKVPLPRARAGRRMPPGICRLDYPRVRGYIVRLSYRRTRQGWKPRFKAYFGDTRHGGKAKAFAAAQEWLRVVTETGKAPAV